MRTSVDIPEPLLRRAKKLAQTRGVTLRQLLVDGLRSIVHRESQVGKHSMRNFAFGRGGLVSGLSWSDTERIDELTYGDRT